MQSINIQERQIQIINLNINYKTIGDGKIPIVLLHGWGISGDKYLELARWLHSPKLSDSETRLWSRNAEDTKPASKTPQPPLSGGPSSSPDNGMLECVCSQYSIIIPDLPGFGKSEEPKENWNLDDYVEFVDKFIEKTSRKGGFELVKDLLKNLNLNKGLTSIATRAKPLRESILIGHSFGGKIATKYAIKYPEKIEKLILTGAAGIKHKLTIKQKIFFILAKTGKAVFSIPVINNFQKPVHKIFSKLARNRKKDYYSASPKMKEIMKNILAEDLTDYLDKIKTPTLLVWGKEDRTTPLSDGKIMNEKIKNSKMVIINNANHSLPYHRVEEFGKIVEKFIKEHE